MRTDNPIRDFLRWDAEREEELKKLPRCSHCAEHIQDDYAFVVNDEWICEDCMRDYYRKEVLPEW